MSPLAPLDVRARQRPLHVLLVYLWQLAWALVATTPAHAWVRRAWGSHPDGDAVLFEDGARALLSMFVRPGEASSIVVQTTFILLVVGAVVAQIPLGALLTALGFSVDPRSRVGPSLGASVRAGVGAFFPLVMILAATLGASALLLVAGHWTGGAFDRALESRLGGASYIARLAVLAFAAALIALVNVLADLWRAALVLALGCSAPRVGQLATLRASFIVALRAARARRTSAIVAWASRAALGALLVLAGYAASSSLGGRGGAALVALAVTHQLVVLGRTALRASWLARALRYALEHGAAEATGSRSDEPRDDDAPAVPADDEGEGVRP